MTKNIYIAGPMQGKPQFNFPAFHEAAEMWRNMNWEVFNPAERDQKVYGKDFGQDNLTGDITLDKTFSLRKALADDLNWIALQADAIYMLKGWEYSKGANAEHALAKALGLEIYYE